MSKSELKDRIIKNFLGVVSEDKDIDLTNFYEKLDTLEVIVGKKKRHIHRGRIMSPQTLQF